MIAKFWTFEVPNPLTLLRTWLRKRKREREFAKLDQELAAVSDTSARRYLCLTLPTAFNIRKRFIAEFKKLKPNMVSTLQCSDEVRAHVFRHLRGCAKHRRYVTDRDLREIAHALAQPDHMNILLVVQYFSGVKHNVIERVTAVSERDTPRVWAVPPGRGATGYMIDSAFWHVMTLGIKNNATYAQAKHRARPFRPLDSA